MSLESAKLLLNLNLIASWTTFGILHGVINRTKT